MNRDNPITIAIVVGLFLVAGSFLVSQLRLIGTKSEKSKTADTHNNVVSLSPGEFKSDISCDGFKYSHSDLRSAVEIKVAKLLPYGDNPYGLSVDKLERNIEALDKIEVWATSAALEDKVRKQYLLQVDVKRKEFSPILNIMRGYADPASRLIREREEAEELKTKARGRKLANCLPTPESYVDGKGQSWIRN